MRGLGPPALDSPPAPQALRGTSTVEQRGRRLCGGFQRGACAPLCVVADEGVTGEKPHRKGFSLRAVFWLLFVRTKSNPGCGAGNPIRVRKETCFSPPPGDGRISPASAGCAGPAPSKSGCGARRPRGESIYIIMYSVKKGITALLHLAAGGPPFHIGEEIPGLLHSNMQLSWFFRQG